MSPARKNGPARTVAVTASTRQDADGRRIRLSAAYVDALENAGLIPLIVPPLSSPDSAAAILAAVDGLLLTGGEDVNPSLYNETSHALLKQVNDARDLTEIQLIREARRRQTPVLAICRGIQVLNVALGGSLLQDIRAQHEGALDHDDDRPRNSPAHTIAVEPDTLTAAALGAAQGAVNSIHHQAVKDVAPELSVSARAPDGIIEGLEARDPDWWVVAVQWHPEEMTDSPRRWDRGIFQAFAARLARAREDELSSTLR